VDADVVVIGGGVAGLFCAYYLRLAGASVTVIERGEIGGPQSCSSGNTGFVGTQGANPLAEPGVVRQSVRWLTSAQSPFAIRPRPSAELARWLWQFSRLCNEEDVRRCFGVLVELKRRSLAILQDVCATGELASTFAEPGMIVAYRTPEGFAKAAAGVDAAVTRGVPLRVLSPAELADLCPGVRFDVAGALFNAEGATVLVPEFVAALGRLLTEMGVKLATGTTVTGFSRRGRQISQVRTSTGDLSADEVVIAAGAWSARCARLLGVRLLLQPAKGYTVTIDAPLAGAPRLPVLLSEGKVALAPLGSRLRFGGTLELAGLDQAPAPRRVAGIVATVKAHLPDLEIGADHEIWTGLRPCAPDSLPYLGRVASFGNLSIASGYGNIGMGLAPAAGQVLAQLLAGERPATDPAPLRAGRFGAS
jgi:D-amino-acid dehydrogenase